MYEFVLSTLLLICLGINNSVHCRSINETETSEPDITDFLSTTVNSLVGPRNCSKRDLDNFLTVYSSCSSTVFNRQEIESHLYNSIEFAEMLNKSCKKLSQCLHNGLLTLDEMCIDDNKVQDEKYKYVALYKWYSFWCQNVFNNYSSSHLATFYHEGGVNCLERESVDVDKCLKLYPVDITKKTCNMLTGTLVCIDGVFQKCKQSNSTINLFESSFDVLYEMKGCPVYRSNKNQTQI